MASNSIIQYTSSSSEIKKTYHVFVSFRGDTRNNFTDHLFDALRRNCIHFFSDSDDRKLKKGKLILTELLQAIEGSEILIVVFSKGYASSKWCLRELEKIANSIEESGKHVLPIFYDVTPSEVRKQEGHYKEAFDEYEEKFKEDKEMMEEVRRWREALSQVANLSGWDIGNKRQAEEIKKIVQRILKILRQNIVSSPNDALVGVESRVEELEKLLLLDSVDVVMSLGIYGLAGIGKSALVNTLCYRIHHYFEFHYLDEDVSKNFKDSNIWGLRKKMLCQVAEENHLEIYNFFPKTNLVCHGRRLIILDNVDHIDQLEKLALDHTCLGAGSRIIIITRDRRILEDYGVNSIYHVQRLNMTNSIQLFYKYAFKGNCVMSEYEMLKYDVWSYLEGHPLLIKVVGRHLAGQDVSQWNNALVKLRENPKKDILDKLRISFDDLEQNEKEIFLDIACFNDWIQGENVMEVLQFRGFEPESGLKTLLEKSLITEYDETYVGMQELLIDLGKYIVKEESPKEPGKRSRLWDYQDLLKVMLQDKAPKNLEAIYIDDYDCIEFSESTINVDALSKMSQLKLLIINGVNFSGNLNYLSNELGYLTWNEYPFKYLPPTFQPNNLVKLVMCNSKIKRLWKGKKALPNLKSLDLSGSKKLVEMPHLGEALNLKHLNFEGCIQLREIHSSIGVLRNLTSLNLKDCKCLDKMRDFGEASNLKRLNLEGCIQLKEIHESIGIQRRLTYLNLKNCKNLVSLPNSLLGLSSLQCLNLSGCSKLYNRHSLEEIRVAKHLIKKLCSIHKAPIHCQPASSIQKKSFMGSVSCLLLSSPSFPCMRYLDLSFCNLHQIPEAIGNLCFLQWLILRGNKFEKMPNLKKLSKLVYINLEHCKQLKYLFELPSTSEFTSRIHSQLLVFYGFEHSEKKGLNMFNCPELVGSEEWSMMSISWMIEIVKEFHIYDEITSVIPGNEIPKWFNNQHERRGNSIRVDNAIPLDHYIGIAFCVVFCISHHQINSFPRTDMQGFVPCIPVLLDVDLVTDKSDHMYLFYLPGSYFTGHIEVELKTAYPDWDVEVKKYGYRWVYEQDLQQSNILSKHCKNSSIRNRNFVEIK